MAVCVWRPRRLFRLFSGLLWAVWQDATRCLFACYGPSGRTPPRCLFRLLRAVCVSASVFCAAFPVGDVCICGRLWLRRLAAVAGGWAGALVIGTPVGRWRVGAWGCWWFLSHCVSERRGLPFTARRMGLQRCPAEGELSSAEQSAFEARQSGSRTPHSQPRANFCCLKKGDPPESSSPLQRAHSSRE